MSTLGTIGQIALTIADLRQSVAFYRDALGLPFLFEAPPSLAFFACGDIRLMLSTPEKEFQPGASSVIYFKVTDIEGTHAQLASRGVSFVDQPHLVARLPDHELWMCFLKDPDGNTLALMEEKFSS